MGELAARARFGQVLEARERRRFINDVARAMGNMKKMDAMRHDREIARACRRVGQDATTEGSAQDLEAIGIQVVKASELKE